MGVRSNDCLPSRQGISSIIDELAIASIIDSDVADSTNSLVRPPVPTHIAALIAAAEQDDNSFISTILTAHPDAVDGRGVAGSTALMESSMRDGLTSATLLLQAGADPTATDPIGWTPLHFAAHNSAPACTAALVAAAPAVASQLNEDGESALDLALARLGDSDASSSFAARRAVVCCLFEATLSPEDAAAAIAELPTAADPSAAAAQMDVAEATDDSVELEKLAALEAEALARLELAEMELELEMLEAAEADHQETAGEMQVAEARSEAGWTTDYPLNMLAYYALQSQNSDKQRQHEEGAQVSSFRLTKLEPVLSRQWTAGHSVRCSTDEALLASLSNSPLAAVTIAPGSDTITTEGLAEFVHRASLAQASGGLDGSVRPDLVLVVEKNDWRDKQLGALAGLAVAKLDISRVTGFTAEDAWKVGESWTMLQAKRIMSPQLELLAAQCDFGDGQLCGLLHANPTSRTLHDSRSVAFQKLDLSKPRCLPPADLAAVCRSGAALQAQGLAPLEPELVLRYCEEGAGPLMRAIGPFCLGKLDISWSGKELLASDLSALTTGEAVHSPDLQLVMQYQDWCDDGRLAAALADRLSIGLLDLTGCIGLSTEDHEWLDRVLCRVVGRDSESSLDATNQSAGNGMVTDDTETTGAKAGAMEQCKTLLIQMMCRADARFFNSSRAISKEATLYHPLIAPEAAREAARDFAQSDHIDFATIAARLRVGAIDYTTETFHADVLRVLATTNGPQRNPQVTIPRVEAGMRLKAWFQDAWAQLST
eukprot:SAG31_NODE_2839_length_5017_cov_2.311102_2_plen_771_part_00